MALAACHSGSSSSASANALPDTTATSATTFGSIILGNDAARWADSVLATLTPDARIAQLFVPRLDIAADAAGYASLRKITETLGMGGILLGKGSLNDYTDLLNYAQAHSKVPLMVTFDGEWGLAMRIPQAPRFPYAMALGASRSSELMRRYGREMARQCRLMGIHVNFAPDLDVNSNPANPVIGFRSFGSDAENVGRLGAAYCCGMADGGILAVGKHFPGHGDTSLDSHKTLPTVGHSLTTLTGYDMLPFRICIEEGMLGIMTGHLRVPALDPTGSPASLSPVITGRWLRDSLHYRGLIFTDALAMKGAALPSSNNCVSALLAGADMLLGSAAPATDFKAVKEAVAAGTIPADTITARCRRVLMYKYALGCNNYHHIDLSPASLADSLSSPACLELIDEMCAASITCVHDHDNRLPLDDSASTVIVVIGDAADFASEINTMLPACHIIRTGKSTPLSAASKAAISNATTVVAAINTNATWAVTAYRNTIAANPATAVLFMANAYKLSSFPGIASLPALVISYDYFPAMGRAAARAIAGKHPMTGRMPVDVPSIVAAGAGIDK